MIPDAHAGAATTIQYDLLLQEAMLHDGSVVDFGIRDGRIAALRPSLEGPAARTIQLERRVVLPGLVESHTHLDKALTVSHSENHSGTLYEAMSCMHHVHCSATSTQLHARALRAARLFIAAGTTTLRTHADVTPTLGLLGVQVLLAVREALRGLLDLQIVALSCDLTGQEGRRMRELVEEALRLGVDAVGGAPVLDRDPREHIDFVFDLAQRYDRPVDLHIDESDDPRDFCLPYLAEKTMAVGYGGRVLAGHCCSLAAVDAATARA
ncbi:MAG TPA: amidohydrolase family protein, partial [Chloroflexota bacterium]|nr:amidohydrolase family protein [Chloroflexota bacterium]